MKKRHKTAILVAAGALVYSIGIMSGVSFLNNAGTDQNTAAISSHVETKSEAEIGQIVSEIEPAAGTEQNKH